MRFRRRVPRRLKSTRSFVSFGSASHGDMVVIMQGTRLLTAMSKEGISIMFIYRDLTTLSAAKVVNYTSVRVL